MILMVSEPTRGIDIGAKKLLLDYLAKLNREQGVTVSHRLIGAGGASVCL